MFDVLNDTKIHGHVRLSRIWENRPRELLTGWMPNSVLYSWATIVGNLLSTAASNYKIGGMLLEYKNVADPDEVITVPAFDRTGGIDYYNGLVSSPDTDFLRIPLLASTVTPSDTGAALSFFAQSQGTVGVNGKPFSDANNSKVYGAALVAVVNPDDRTQDVVFSRYYTATDRQQLKLPNSQIGLEWKLSLE